MAYVQLGINDEMPELVDEFKEFLEKSRIRYEELSETEFGIYTCRQLVFYRNGRVDVDFRGRKYYEFKSSVELEYITFDYLIDDPWE